MTHIFSEGTEYCQNIYWYRTENYTVVYFQLLLVFLFSLIYFLEYVFNLVQYYLFVSLICLKLYSFIFKDGIHTFICGIV